MGNKECKHEWELINVTYDEFNTIHHYKCSKCGAEDTISLSI